MSAGIVSFAADSRSRRSPWTARATQRVGMPCELCAFIEKRPTQFKGR